MLLILFYSTDKISKNLMHSLRLLNLLVIIQVLEYAAPSVDGFELGNIFLTIFPQYKDPNALEKEGTENMPVKFYLYDRTTTSENTLRRMDDHVVMDRDTLGDSVNAMNHSLPTLMIIHGFLENIRAKVITDVIEATTRAKRWNVILVDWRELSAGPWYRSAVLNVRATGVYVADFLDRIAEAIDGQGEESPHSISDKKSSEYRPSEKFFKELHVVGFSLGSHVAGIAGLRLTKGRIGHITALDPALPMVDLLNPVSERIDKTDADFVDVWHTSNWGIFHPIGHVDFYPNGGTSIQPGCFSNLLRAECSHWNAWRYFASSVLNPEAFESIPCESWSAFESGLCNKYTSHINNQDPVYMSVDVRKTARGKFYLRTSPDFPYFIPLPKY